MNKYKKWFTSLVVGLVLDTLGCIALPTALTAGDIPPPIMAWSEANVVKIHAGRYTGSGFFISPTQVITACHVVTPWIGVYISQEGSKVRYPASVEECDLEGDLALLELHGALPDTLTTEIIKYTPNPGRATYSTGYPTALPLIITEGHWQRQNNIPKHLKDSFIDTGHSINGNSGSPILVFKEGKVLVVSMREAVLVIGNQQYEDLTFAVNPSRFRAFYDKHIKKD